VILRLRRYIEARLSKFALEVAAMPIPPFGNPAMMAVTASQ
jgi:hypothetical protein